MLETRRWLGSKDVTRRGVQVIRRKIVEWEEIEYALDAAVMTSSRNLMIMAVDQELERELHLGQGLRWLRPHCRGLDLHWHCARHRL